MGSFPRISVTQLFIEECVRQIVNVVIENTAPCIDPRYLSLSFNDRYLGSIHGAVFSMATFTIYLTRSSMNNCVTEIRGKEPIVN